MTDILAALPWQVLAALFAGLGVALAVRRWGGASVARLGEMLVWLVLLATAAWAGLTLYQAFGLLRP